MKFTISAVSIVAILGEVDATAAVGALVFNHLMDLGGQMVCDFDVGTRCVQEQTAGLHELTYQVRDKAHSIRWNDVNIVMKQQRAGGRLNVILPTPETQEPTETTHV